MRGIVSRSTSLRFALVGGILALQLFFQNCAQSFHVNTQNSDSSTAQLASTAGETITPPVCSFDGRTVKDGDAVTAYLDSAPQGTCVSESRQCNEGSLSGSFAYATCQVSGQKSCLFDGRTIKDGEVVTAYLNSTDKTCVSEKRTCNNGVLSGQYAFSSCQTQGEKSCLFNGQTLFSGASVTAFQNSSVPAGAKCEKEIRTCKDGALSGSWTNSSCSVDAPKTCQFNGVNIASGASVIAFKESSAPATGSCTQESRPCLDGVLQGSYPYATCTISTLKTCTWNGVTLSHGQTVTAFKKGTVSSAEGCQAETRTCQDGTMTGSYSSPSCQIDASTICDTSITNSTTNLTNQKSCAEAPDLTCQKVSSINWHVSLVDYHLNAPSGDYFYTCESQLRRYHHAYSEKYISKLLGDNRDLSCMYYPASSVPINALTPAKMAWLCLPNQQNINFTFHLENGIRCVLFNGVGTFYLCSGEQKDDQQLTDVASVLNKYNPGTVPFTCGYNAEKYAIIGQAELGISNNSSEVNFACARLKTP